MKNHISVARMFILASLVFFGFQTSLMAQAAEDPGITVYQYRKVAPDKQAEFVKRETTYWAEVAKKAMAAGNLTFWALLEKVGGYDLENSSNYLIVNTYKNIDGMGDVWTEKNVKAAFPNVTADKMDTWGMSTVTSNLFLRTGGWEQSASAEPEKDFKYIAMLYHDAPQPGNFIQLENEIWAPFIKGAMDKNLVSQKGWGNARILSPTDPDMHATTVSYDLYPSLKEALNPTWDRFRKIPERMSEIGEAEKGRSGVVYRIVKVVTPQ